MFVSVEKVNKLWNIETDSCMRGKGDMDCRSVPMKSLDGKHRCGSLGYMKCASLAKGK